MPRSAPALRPDAIPRLFEGVPTYLSSPKPLSRSDPEKRRNIATQKKEKLQSEWLLSDSISSFDQFSTNVQQYLESSFPSILHQTTSDHVVLYKLGHNEDPDHCLSVPLTIRIYNTMSVSVWVNNSKLPQSAFGWIMSHTKWQLTLWSQLQNLLSRYSIDTPTIDVASRSKSIASDVELFGIDIDQQHCCNF